MHKSKNSSFSFSIRLFDVSISCFLLILLLPLLVLTSLIVKYKLGSPVFFKQVRPGFEEKPFTIYKFRTMKNLTNLNGEQLSDNKRLNNFGKLLRSTSIDELPELWNVIKGDMSLVGPRPLLMEYLPLYSRKQAQRHSVKPGITGWAQINGRNSLSWEDKLDLDIWYVNNKSFWLDVKILFLTFYKVFKKDGINSKGHVTVEKFKGN